MRRIENKGTQNKFEVAQAYITIKLQNHFQFSIWNTPDPRKLRDLPMKAHSKNIIATLCNLHSPPGTYLSSNQKPEP